MVVSTFFHRNIFATIICCVLFFIPFFWYDPGAIDLGGDGNRLYFYNPEDFIRYVSSFSIASEDSGIINPSRHAYLGYVSLIRAVSWIIPSTSLVIGIFNGLKLSLGFLSIYLIIKELIRQEDTSSHKNITSEIVASIAGVFYICATGSEKLIYFWIKALHSHDQVFLNPLIFYLILKYFVTKRKWYVAIIFIITLLFSSNFAMISAPSFFAFYPLSLIFLILYVTYIRKIKISIKEVSVLMVIFIGLHSFHLLPSIVNVLDDSSAVNSIVFKESVSGGVNFFAALRGEGKALLSILMPAPLKSFNWLTIFVPVTLLIGLIIHSKKNKTIQLIGSFYLFTFFLITVNITEIGYQFYRLLFHIPGFSMFRHFYVQWAFIYLFFYSIFFGLILWFLFRRFKKIYLKIITFVMLTSLVIGHWPFLNGNQVDGIHWGSNNVKTAIVMDPRYEETLSFIKQLPKEGKMIMFPLTDNYLQVLYGLNEAAYVGPSSISVLTGMKTFSGYQNFYPRPIPDELLRLVKEKKYEQVQKIFSLFSIRYIFHNSDTRIYEANFPQFPNSYMMSFMPKTQAEYIEFIKHFPVHQIYQNGPYAIYEFNESTYKPEVYMADSVAPIHPESFFDAVETSPKSLYVANELCEPNNIFYDVCQKELQPGLVMKSFRQITPVTYEVIMTVKNNLNPAYLVMQNHFHKSWRLQNSENGDFVSDTKHISVNVYANGWILDTKNLTVNRDYKYIISLQLQKYFVFGLWISGFTGILGIVYLIFPKFKKNT